SLPRALVMDADLPAYSAEQCRKRMLHDLDQAATTGLIPGDLLRRWEEALEDTTLWQFSTRVVHGDLHEDNITVDHGSLASFTGWSDLHVGDPAVDFSWLVGMSDPAFADTVIEAYSVAAVQPPDRHLLRRAHLKAEFALAEWLVRGVDRGITSMVDNAQRMLTTLAADVRASASPSPGVAGPPPASTASAAASGADRAGDSDVDSVDRTDSDGRALDGDSAPDGHPSDYGLSPDHHSGEGGSSTGGSSAASGSVTPTS
ncbi:phosphotransferase, partial [Streptomyces sp. tea 10]|nr:phosphotransferase [Streptomyces sp. tea 10]